MFIRFACLIKNTNKTHLIVRMEKSGGYRVDMLFLCLYLCIFIIAVFLQNRAPPQTNSHR